MERVLDKLCLTLARGQAFRLCFLLRFFFLNAQEPQTGYAFRVREANHSLISESSSPIRIIRKLMASVVF